MDRTQAHGRRRRRQTEREWMTQRLAWQHLACAYERLIPSRRCAMMRPDCGSNRSIHDCTRITAGGYHGI
jgi:hypothetical protein